MPQVMTILNCLHFDKIIFDPEVEVRCIPYRAIKIRGSDPGYVAIVLNLPVFYVVIFFDKNQCETIDDIPLYLLTI